MGEAEQEEHDRRHSTRRAGQTPITGRPPFDGSCNNPAVLTCDLSERDVIVAKEEIGLGLSVIVGNDRRAKTVGGQNVARTTFWIVAFTLPCSRLSAPLINIVPFEHLPMI